MKIQQLFALLTGALLVLAENALGHGRAEGSGALQFKVSFDPAFQSTPYTGRVYVVISDQSEEEPRMSINNWFRPPQVFAKDVKDLSGADSVSLGDGALYHPSKLADLQAREYRVQAVARRSPDHPVPGKGPGDLYSQVQTLTLDHAQSGLVELRLDQVVAEPPFEESDRVKAVELVSPLLSKFHERPMRLRAGVVLPKDWKDDPAVRYPVLYMIGGFGSDHRLAHRMANMKTADNLADEVLIVVPDPTCYRGHSVFADSDNNGPWGRALVEELIPLVEKKFHGVESPVHRYVTGVSSGGWSSLWLQVTYPDVFNGCWSHCPDPVDFRDFQRINLYAEGNNMYTDQRGGKRPLARRGDRVVIEYENFVRAEDVLGPGGQIHSFEAVFSPRASDGQPRPLFDRASGRIDTGVARTWERFDIRLVLERNWPALKPKLAGKLHIYAGGQDMFYLEGAVALLKESLHRLGSDATVVVVPDMGHGLYRDAIEPMFRTIVGRAAGGRDN